MKPVSAIESQQKERELRQFEIMVEGFLQRWKPDDRYEASRFEAEMFSIVRQIYVDAQAPVLDHLTHAYPVDTHKR